MAEGADRDRLLVPWTSFAIGRLDLWLEQYRCYHLGLPVPTELSEPEEDSSFPDTDSTTTTAGLVLIPRVLDEPAGESEGKHLLRVEVATSSRIEQAVLDAGHEPNGYFLAGLAACVAGGVDGLAPDPEGDGDGVSFLGGEEDLAALGAACRRHFRRRSACGAHSSGGGGRVRLRRLGRRREVKTGRTRSCGLTLLSFPEPARPAPSRPARCAAPIAPGPAAAV